MVANFVTYQKVLINDVTHRKIFPSFEILVNFLGQVEKSNQNSQTTRKVNLRA